MSQHSLLKKTSQGCCIAVVLICGAFFNTARCVTAADVAGNWAGTISVGAIELRVIVKITADESGSLTATMDSPDQGAKDIPVDSVILVADSLYLKLPPLSANFAGQYFSEGDSVAGFWSQGGMSLPLTLTRAGEIQEPKRPQEPQPPFPYISEDVTFANEKAGITLAGTLTMPETGAPFAAAVLVSGSALRTEMEMSSVTSSCSCRRII